MVKKVRVAGLSEAEVDASRGRYGANTLPAAEVESFFDKLKDNFDDPLIKILMVALCVTLGLAAAGYAEWTEAVGIAVAVFLATFVATYSEFKNEASFQELQEKASRIKCMVFRSAELVEIEIADIVVGDSVLLQAGNRVPADGFILDGAVEANQASLTGESDPVSKVAVPAGYSVPDSAADDDLMAGNHHVFRGSLIDSGEGVLLVTAVGVETVFGKLALEISTIDEREAPLTIKLAELADDVARVGYIGASLIACAFLFKQFVIDNGFSLPAIIAYASNWQIALHDVVTSLILAIIVIVVAVPEGLPMMIAIVLSLNMRKLLADQVLVRRLLGIETAGCMNLLFSDKTGTMTQGVFQPRMFVTGSASFDSYAHVPPALSEILAVALCESSSAIVSSNGEDIVGGNSSDRALLRYLSRNALVQYSSFGAVKEDAVLFSSVHKFSAAQIAFSAEDADAHLSASLAGLASSSALGRPSPAAAAAGAASSLSLYKGAAELVLSKCTHYHDEASGALVPLPRASVSSILATVDAASSTGYRFIAVATSAAPLAAARGSNSRPPALPRGLALVGVIGMTDEVRPETAGAIADAEGGGIQVVMVTGDRAETAAAIAQQVGLVADGSDLSVVLTSTQLAHMDDDELAAALPSLRVVARALPTDKSRLVRVAQNAGYIVSMTGDGANDVSALKAADVSFAMGDGAEIAKEASDIVVLDSHFASVIRASLYGRTIFRSIRKFCTYQSICNCASLLLSFAGPWVGFDQSLTLIQLLWINLIMDTLAALAFGGEPALARFMREAPVSRTASLISPYMWSSILWNGVGIAAYSVFFLTSDFVHDLFDRAYVAPATDGTAFNDDVAAHETATEIAAQGGSVFLSAFFSFFVFLVAFNAFGVRTPSLNLLSGISGNVGFMAVVATIFAVQVAMTQYGGDFLRTVPLTSHEWLILLAMTSVAIPFDLLRKILIVPALGSKAKQD